MHRRRLPSRVARVRLVFTDEREDVDAKSSRREVTRTCALLFTIVFLGCGGKSAKDAGPISQAGAAAGIGGTSGSGGAELAGGGEKGGSGGSGTGVAEATGSVDAFGACRGGLDYFISIGGDLPPSTVTSSCTDDAKVTMVPTYNELHGLDPAEDRAPALVGCNGTERLEVWRFSPNEELSTAGYYASPDGTTYSTCGTSRPVRAPPGCSPLGWLEVTPRADDSSVLEGSYAITLFGESGKSYAVNGSFRVCAYLE
jgi:hypothetical protein